MSARSEESTTRRRGSAKRQRASTARPAPIAEEGPVSGPTPRTGAKKTLMYYMQQLPNYLRLLAGLLTDRRVSGVDKLLVAGAIAYILMPVDLVPDFIPFLGEVDDVYFLVMALQRLIANAGRTVLLAHWAGSATDLAEMNLRAVISAAAFFLPGRMRRRLRGMMRR